MSNYWPDFGTISEPFRDITLTCRAIVPGMSTHDLVCLYSDTKKSPESNDLAGNPSEWGVTRGVKAVVEAVLKAVGKWDADVFYSRDEYHEDHGPVLWWHLGEYGEVCEAPFVGTMNDPLDEPWFNYYTHWSRLPQVPRYPVRELKLAPMGTLICD